LIPTALFAAVAGPLIDRVGATTVLWSAYIGQAVAMAATALALLDGAPPVAVYACATVTAMLLTVTHPAHAVTTPALAHTAEELVTLNAATGWVLSVGLVVAPGLAGVTLAFAGPGVVYVWGALAAAGAAVLIAPLRGLV